MPIIGTFKHTREICKLGQGEDCCAFIVMGMDGFECVKGTLTQQTIELKLAEGTMNAKDDNCKGYGVSED